jgi:hypothetical protein
MVKSSADRVKAEGAANFAVSPKYSEIGKRSGWSGRTHAR